MEHVYTIHRKYGSNLTMVDFKTHPWKKGLGSDIVSEVGPKSAYLLDLFTPAFSCICC